MTIKNTKTILAAAATSLLLSTLLAACSSDGPADDVSTAADGPSGGSITTCLAEKGYDIPESSGGSQTLTAPDGVDEEQWAADMQACSKSTGAGQNVQRAKPAGSPEQQKAYAKCIRENGFEDFPDSAADSGKMYQPDDEDAFLETSERCADEVFEQ